MIAADVMANEKNVPKAYRNLGKLVLALKTAGHDVVKMAEGASATAQGRLDFLRAFTFAEEFVNNGAPTYVLSHSIAAALTATKAPALPFAHCPFSAFLIEIPSEFLPLAGHTRPKVWVSVLAVDAMRAVAVHVDGCGSEVNLTAVMPDGIGGDAWFREEGLGNLASPQDKTIVFEMRLAMRLASNTVAFVTAYRESVKRRVGTPSDVRLLDVACPREVCVDRAFRDQVISLVGARTIPRARGVLAHLVRGHWRHNGEKLLWIAPYARGDEKIGKIVVRVERIETSSREQR